MMLGHGSANCRLSTLAIWTLRFAASSSSPTNCALSSLSFNSLKCFSMRSTSSCKLSATASEGCGSLPCGSSSWLREPVARGLGRGARFGLPVGHIQLVGQTQEFPPLLTRDFPFSVVCHGGSLTLDLLLLHHAFVHHHLRFPCFGRSRIEVFVHQEVFLLP